MGQRISLLLALLCLVAGLEWIVRGRGATRWREYAFVVVCGALAAVYGAANDLVTSSLSPDYFIAGKGIAPGAGFIQRVLALGAAAGFSAGAVAASLLLYANNPVPTRARIGYVRLAAIAIRMVPVAAGVSLLAWISCRLLVARAELVEVWFALSAERAVRFASVWAGHAGLYLGVAIGLARACWTVRAVRRAGAPTPVLESM